MSNSVSIVKDLIVALLPAFILIMTACSSDDSDSSDVAIDEGLRLDLPELYSTVRSIYVEVVYEPGAEPFTGSTPGGIQYWSISEENLRSIFQGRSIEPQVSVPKDLSEMNRIDYQNQPSWTADEIVDLAGRIAGTVHDPSIVEIYVMFLQGYFNDEGTDNPKVVGVSVRGTPIIAVFKKVILTTSSTPLWPGMWSRRPSSMSWVILQESWTAGCRWRLPTSIPSTSGTARMRPASCTGRTRGRKTSPSLSSK